MKKWAYYNEHDKFAAAWIRELMKAGLIMQGEVDERSIEDVLPSDVSGFTRCHWFAGVAVWDFALNRAGWPDDRRVWTGSCPCQPFSSAGKGVGFADERHLWPAFHHLIAQCKPDVVFGEQVASKDGLAWLDLVLADLEGTGYAAGAVDTCSAGFGAPHIRQRLYWVAAGVGQRLEGWRGTECGKQRTDGQADTLRASDRLENTKLSAQSRFGHDGGEGIREQEAGGFARTSVVGGLRTESDSAGLLCRLAQSPSDRCAGRGSSGQIETRSTTGRDAKGSRTDERGELSAGFEGSGVELRGGVADAPDSSASEERACGIGQLGLHAEGGRVLGDARNGERAESIYSAEEHPRPTNGFWRDADWLFCRDGKWRPVEPGTFPLVDGPAKGLVQGSNSSIPFDANKTGEARVMRLRGYGNAINAEAARVFVESCMGMLGI